MKRRNLTLVIFSMGAGGTERVVSVLSDKWVQQGCRVTLIVLSDMADCVYSLNALVTIKTLSRHGESEGIISAFVANLYRLHALRRAISRSEPDIVITLMTDISVLCLLALIGKRLPVIVCEHSDPFVEPVHRVWRMLRRCTFPLADRIVVLNHYAASFFTSRIQSKIVVIPNPVQRNNLVNVPEQRVIAIGRLEYVKRYDMLINAFAIVHRHHPEWMLTILGDGVLKNTLQQQIKSLGLETIIELPGRIENPDLYLCTAAIFVLCSEYEGFPMALCEAMSAAVASISVYYHPGVTDIITDAMNGLIVYEKNVDSLSQAITKLIEYPMLRKELAVQGKLSMQRFSWNNIGRQWDQVFSECC